MKKLCTFFIVFILLINNQYVFAGTKTSNDKTKYIINKVEFFDNQAPYQLVEKTEVRNQAWYLSFIVPGLGQMIMGEHLRGFIYLLLSIILIPITILLIIFQIDYSSRIYHDGSRGQFGIPPLFMWVSIGLTSIIYILNIFDAYSFYKEIQSNNQNSISSFFDANKFSFNNQGLSYNVIAF